MSRHDEIQTHVAVHSFAWLLAGLVVGLLLSALLIWPEAGNLLGALSYGRWATVHLNIQLYGWCSVPLLGLLFRWYLPRESIRSGLMALQAWSGALLFSMVAWLAGEVSGKPFMEWRGNPRWIMPCAMILLAIVLARGYARRLRDAPEQRWIIRIKAIALLAMTFVPPTLAWAADPKIYPVINPDSGGATGGSLLGSTLGIVILFLAFPWISGLPLKRRGKILPGAWILLTLHYSWFLLLDHGHRSHHEPAQIVALFSLILWWPALVVYLRAFVWPEGSSRWLAAFALWSAALLATALYTFLPGVLDGWKYTNALVAHTHIAMAGMLSCFLMLILVALSEDSARRAALTHRGNFLLWNISAYAMVGSLLWLGTLEAKRPALVYFSEPASQLVYLLRLCAGLVMTIPAARWLRASLHVQPGETP